MLHITPTTMAAMEAAYDRQAGRRFAAWWQDRAAALGPRDRFSCVQLYDRMGEELDITGLASDEQRFLFVAARCRMPDMDDRQYLRVMDVIVSDIGESDKLTAIDAIALRTVAHGQ